MVVVLQIKQLTYSDLGDYITKIFNSSGLGDDFSDCPDITLWYMYVVFPWYLKKQHLFYFEVQQNTGNEILWYAGLQF